MTRYTRDDIDKFHDYDIHIPTRTIYMGPTDNNGITDVIMAERILKNLHILDSMNNNPIRIIMNNPGGYVSQGFAIYDAIKACKSHVSIVCHGECESMATVILQAADERILAANVTFMVHIGTTEYQQDHVKNIKNKIKHDDVLEEKCNAIYLEKIREKHPEYTKKQLEAKINFDWIPSPEEAIEFGLADKLLE